MSQPFSIRRAAQGDALSISRLTETLGYAADFAAMRQRLRAILGSTTDLVIVAIDSTGAVVGWLQAHAAHILESGFRVEITGLVVSSEVRRRGVGRLLVGEAERWAKEVSAESIVVRSNVQRSESHTFYPALAYSLSKTQKVYRKPLANPPHRSLKTDEFKCRVAA